MSAGLRTSVAPALSSACIFSAAVPLPPETMAPAEPEHGQRHGKEHAPGQRK